jgi:hypothetical protein
MIEHPEIERQDLAPSTSFHLSVSRMVAVILR